jgi:hypothetical protein
MPPFWEIWGVNIVERPMINMPFGTCVSDAPTSIGYRRTCIGNYSTKMVEVGDSGIEGKEGTLKMKKMN